MLLFIVSVALFEDGLLLLLLRSHGISFVIELASHDSIARAVSMKVVATMFASSLDHLRLLEQILNLEHGLSGIV